MQGVYPSVASPNISLKSKQTWSYIHVIHAFLASKTKLRFLCLRHACGILF